MVAGQIKKLLNYFDKNLTLKKLCNYIGVEIPAEYKKYKNKHLNWFSCNINYIRKGGAFFVVSYGSASKVKKARKAFLGGAKYIFSDEQFYLENGEKIPYIYVAEPNKAYYDLCKKYVDKIGLNVVAITGSIGKTTTKEMVYSVLDQKFKTYKNMGNFNQIITLSNTIYRLNKSYDYYVQEMGAGIGDLKIISNMSYTLSPFVAVITNIGSSHLEVYKTKENLIKVKTGIEDYVREDGYVLVNGDDDSLFNYKFKHKVRYFGFDSKNDYYAENIEQNGIVMKFDIVDKILNNRLTVELKMFGKHNIYNVLTSYAVGKIAGISDELIINGLKAFKTTGIRQNYVEIDGYKLFIDCYNAAPLSVVNALKVVKDIKIACENKKIAVLGDMLELGDDEVKLHKEIGRVIKDYGIDYLICYGKLSKYICDCALESGIKAVCSADKSVIIKEILKIIKPGDLILFKASQGIHLEKIIDEIFKTEFSKKKR